MTELKEILKDRIKGTVLFGEDIEQKYLTDFIGRTVGTADAYVKAADESDVKAVLKTAYENRINVVVRGAGTNLTGATIPEGGIVLDLSGMNRILELDENTLTVTVEPGVVLSDLKSYVKERGYYYAPDPAEQSATIGGNVSTNAGGMSAVKYGVTRNYVLSLDLVKMDGTKLTLGAKTYKYSTGLNLQQLVVGSEGTLGVITKIVLKLLPLPDKTLNTVLAYSSLKDAVENVNLILHSNLAPTAVEFIEKSVVGYGEEFCHKKFPCESAKAYLIVTLDGADADVNQRFNSLKSLVQKNGAIDVISLEDENVARDVWEIRSSVAKAVNATGEWEPVDIVVPIDHIVDYVDYVKTLSGNGFPRIVAFGHAGDGNIHLCILRDSLDENAWTEQLHKTMETLYHKAYELGGVVSGEHGVGRAKQKYFADNSQSELLTLMSGIKKSFDEYNLLNPHCSYNLKIS